MTNLSIRLPILISLFLLLFLAVVISKAPIVDSHAEGRDGGREELARSTEMGLASPSAGYASPQSGSGAEHVFALAAHRFEPLLLLLLGSILLFIGSGIKLLLSRRLRRNPGLLKGDK
jgi:hypothetical protein